MLDHNVPTINQAQDVSMNFCASRSRRSRRNCAEFGVTICAICSGRQGIVHVIGPELGLTLPGQTIVCGDSHTSTHGAFGSLAFGIGTSEVEHVLATQTLWQSKKPRTLGVQVNGVLPRGLEPKDVILGDRSKFGVGGGTGFVVEYLGPAIRALSMEARMTVCNMSIEAGGACGYDRP